MAINGINVGQELLNVPMGEMIKSMAMAIADGQWALDKSSMTVAELMSGQRMVRDLDSGRLSTDKDGKPIVVDSRVFFGYTYEPQENGDIRRVPNKVSMMELGFTPNFYQFVDTIIEVRIAISMKGETQSVESSSTKTDDHGSSQSSNSYDTHSWWWGWGQSSGGSSQSRTTATTSQVNASYANKYSYSVEGSSLLRTKLVPVPPPAVLEERIRELMVLERAYIEWVTTSQALKAERAKVGGDADKLKDLEARQREADRRLASAQ